jgi:tetratricopeptide (TPR) repeat protein
VAADVDPVRAVTPVTKVEPALEPPKRPEGLPALSERGAKQIAAAKRLIDEQRYTEASLELERALRFDPNHYEIHRALALLHWQAGNIERARTHASKTLEANPDCAAAHYILGRCYTIGGDKASALVSFRTAVLCSDLDEDKETAALCHYHLGQALASEGYLQASLAEFDAFERAAKQLGPSPARLELAALLRSTKGIAGEERSQVLEKLGRFGEAADAIAPFITSGLPDVERGKRYARLLAQAGRFEAAVAAARSVPADDSEFVAFLFDLHNRAGHPEGMIEDLRTRVLAKPDDAAMLVHLADALERLNRGPEARAELRDFLERHSEAHAIRARLLELLAASGEGPEAVAVAAEGIRCNPERTSEWEARLAALAGVPHALEEVLGVPPEKTDDAATSYLRAVLANAADRKELASAYFARSLELDRSFVAARIALASSHLSAYEYEDSLRIASRTDPDRPEDARLERILGQVYDALDDIEKAEFHFRAATQLDRDDLKSMFALARLYRRTDRVLQAQRQLRVLLEKEPNHDDARELLALLYLKEGKRDVFAQEIEELRRRTRSAATAARCRTFLEPELIRDMAARRRVLTEGLGEGPGDAAIWVAIAETYEGSDAAAAREAYVKALELEPHNEDATLGAVRAAQALLDFEEAAQRLRGLLPVRPNRHEWRRGLIELYGILQDYDAAMALAEAAEARRDLPAPQQRSYRAALIATLTAAGRIDEAIQHLRTWSDSEPADRGWKHSLADLLREQERPHEAVPIYEELVRQETKDADLRREFLDALIHAERHDRATQFALEWLQDDPENDQLIGTLAEVLAIQTRMDDAIELVQTRLLRTAQREWFQDLLVRRLTIAKRYAESIELTESLIDEVITILRSVPEGGRRRAAEQPRDDRIAQRPNDPSTLDELQGRLVDLRAGRRGLPGLASQLLADKQFRKAEQQVMTWLETAAESPARTRYLLALVDAQRAQGNEAQAGVSLERALTLLPTHPTLNNDTAYLWIERGERLDEAEKLIRFAVGREPRQAAYLDTYGWLLYKKGDFEGAKKWLVRANHARGGKDPVLNDHLGDTLWRLKQPDKAMEHWEQAVKLSNEREQDARIADDERRVRTVTPIKIEEAKAGGSPPVAPSGGEPHPPAPGAKTGTP